MSHHPEILALTHVRHLSRRWDQPTAREWANVLAGFALFTGVSKRRLRRLASSATLAEFAPGETIRFTGDRDEALYVILSGHAKARSRGNDRVLRVGEYFGEAGVLDGRAHSAAVVAMSHVHVMKIPSSAVVGLGRRQPGITLTRLGRLTTRLRELEAEGSS